MATLEFAARVGEDFRRFLDHFDQYDMSDAAERLDEIRMALRLLTHSPFVGRPLRGNHRELIIGRGARGYVAFYRYDRGRDAVTVLAIRNQREDDYKC